ncbi:UNKNOWN [Stylonychia lemnae]|uniref:Uncharacterized protein n=1 Tax=Stylonychia lemnae TaxID=5949 RepID=A0A078AVU3_STYLE|nr:UNKNOWN [Stylonychia lemnae]|eukprot:CDW86299.1 UNKNOWN [Stylonychia lemnae]
MGILFIELLNDQNEELISCKECKNPLSYKSQVLDQNYCCSNVGTSLLGLYLRLTSPLAIMRYKTYTVSTVNLSQVGNMQGLAIIPNNDINRQKPMMSLICIKRTSLLWIVLRQPEDWKRYQSSSKCGEAIDQQFQQDLKDTILTANTITDFKLNYNLSIRFNSSIFTNNYFGFILINHSTSIEMLQQTSKSILSLDDEAKMYFDGVCDQFGFQKPCFKTIDLTGNIQSDRRISFDTVSNFNYELGDLKQKSLSVDETIQQNSGGSETTFTYSQNYQAILDFIWKVNTGLSIQGFDVYTNQNYALTDFPEISKNQERIKLDSDVAQDFKVQKKYIVNRDIKVPAKQQVTVDYKINQEIQNAVWSFDLVLRGCIVVEFMNKMSGQMYNLNYIDEVFKNTAGMTCKRDATMSGCDSSTCTYKVSGTYQSTKSSTDDLQTKNLPLAIIQ